MAGARHGAAHPAVRERYEGAVEQGEEAGLGAVLDLLAVLELLTAGCRDHEGGGLGRLHGVVQEEPVEPVEDLPHAEALPGQQTQPGPGEAGDDGGLGSAALDVPEHETPAAAGAGEEVVEVAADHAVVTRLVHQGAGDPGYLGDLAGQEAALQDAADGGLPGVGAGGAHGEAHPAYEVREEDGHLVGDVVVAFPAHEEGAERAAARDDAVGERGSRPVPALRGAAGPGYGDGAGTDAAG